MPTCQHHDAKVEFEGKTCPLCVALDTIRVNEGVIEHLEHQINGYIEWERKACARLRGDFSPQPLRLNGTTRDQRHLQVKEIR